MKHYTTTTTHHHHHRMYLTSKFPSWEEQNPASFHQVEPFGGFIWPPRSYTCTFCRREFRSAQALGGHMNVHRRDRARLKQSSPAPEIKNHSPGPIFVSNDQEFVETKLTMGIDFENVVCKRYKKSSSSNNIGCPLPVMNSEVCSSMEDIDLELRLGDSPAVK